MVCGPLIRVRTACARRLQAVFLVALRFEQAVAVSLGGILRISLFRNQGAGVIYWDDVSV
jgi:hypothetical protein